MPKVVTLYKLTNRNNESRGGISRIRRRFKKRKSGSRKRVPMVVSSHMKWGPGIAHSARGKGNRLCTNNVIHAYIDPYLAVMFDSHHGRYLQKKSAKMWIARGVVVAGDPEKVGVKKLTTIRKVKMPKVSPKKKKEFLARLMLLHTKSKALKEWCRKYLRGRVTDTVCVKALKVVFQLGRARQMWWQKAVLLSVLFDTEIKWMPELPYSMSRTSLLKCLRETFGPLPKRFLP